jgi:hypothetical protein
MRQVPWITLAIAVIFFISPPSLKLLNSAFFSGEQLARTMSQFVLEIMAAILAALGFIEWGIKFYLRRRRSKQSAGAATP